MRIAGLILGFLCAVGLGIMFGRSTDSTPARQPVRSNAPEQVPVRETLAPVSESKSAENPTPDAVPADGVDPAETLKTLLGREPSKERAEQVRRLTAEIRTRALQAARSAELTAARRVAEEIKKQEALLEDLERGGTMTLLKKLQSEPAHMLDLADDGPRFAAMFERKIDGGVVLGTTLGPRDRIEDGTVLHFPAGAHVWKTSHIGRRRNEPFPKDLLVRGDGMDTTLVRLDEISARSVVCNLTFQDCTIDCGNDYFTDLRRDEPVTIRLERCRVIRFDMGAGGSCMLAAQTAAFHAIDCRIEAGFGRYPGSGNLFRVGNGLLVRMEGCTIVGPFSSVFYSDDAATYVFDGCTFERQAVPLESPPAGVRFVRCTSTPPDRTRPDKPRPLSDLNPDWGED